MNPTRLLGVIALLVGSIAFVSEFAIGDELLKQTIGFEWASLRPSYGLTTVLGLLALWSETSTS